MARHEGSVTCLIVSHGRIFSGAVDGMVKVRTCASIARDAWVLCMNKALGLETPFTAAIRFCQVLQFCFIASCHQGHDPGRWAGGGLEACSGLLSWPQIFSCTMRAQAYYAHRYVN